MATLQSMLDDLNDRLNDTGNSQATLVRKTAWINSGIAAMWPKLYRSLRDNSIVATAEYEYVLPATFAFTKLVRVEQESAAGSGRYVDVFDVDLVPDIGAPVLVFRSTPPNAGAKLRLTAAQMIGPMAVVGDVYGGPLGSEELPVLYAMGIATGRRLDDRVDHRRYSSTQAPGVVTVEEMMDVSQFWFSQFELILERQALPLPSQSG